MASYWLTRFVFFRLLGLIYAVAFLIVVFQWPPLLGSDGLLPAASFLDAVGSAEGRGPGAFLRLPSVFWLDASDAAFRVGGYVGLGLSLLVLLGLANVPILFVLWLLYMSFVHVGQIFYGYGWEMLLLETGFLAIFLAPLWNPAPFPKRAPASPIVIVLLRWLVFRLMLAVAVASFDDGLFARLLPASLRARLDRHVAGAEETKARRIAAYALASIVAFLSLNPLMNMLSPGQVMNTSFDPFDLVNTYGAFGSIGRERYEIVLEGTGDDPADTAARWVEYDFKCKPGTPERRPCWISPYHYRLDWQMWFQDMPGAPMEPWFVHLVGKLLQGDRATRALLAAGPFEDRPPRAVRARYYRYEFTRLGEPTRAWWKRTLASEYLPALVRDDPRLVEYLRREDGRRGRAENPSTESAASGGGGSPPVRQGSRPDNPELFGSLPACPPCRGQPCRPPRLSIRRDSSGARRMSSRRGTCRTSAPQAAWLRPPAARA